MSTMKILSAFFAVSVLGLGGVMGDDCPPRYTNKTFLKPRSHGVNLALTHPGISKLLHKEKWDKEEKVFAQAVVFQTKSLDREDTGAYFGINNTNTFSLRDLASAAGISPVDAIPVTTDNITIALKPKQNAYGVVFSVLRTCPQAWEGLFFEADYPVVHVEHDLKVTFTGNQQATNFFSSFYAGQSVLGQALVVGPRGVPAPAIAPINGNLLKEQRQYALMAGKQSLTGLADIDVRVGQRLYHNKWLCCAAKLGLTIPTSPKPEGRYLFEPVLGNGQHWACGGDASAHIKLCRHCDYRVGLDLAGRYRYLFRSNERRMVESSLWGQPANPLLVSTVNERQLDFVGTRFPAALSDKFHVEPRHQFDGIVALSYKRSWFTADLGYNFYYRSSEQLAFKDNSSIVERRGLGGMNGVRGINPPVTANQATVPALPGTTVPSTVTIDTVVPFNTQTMQQATRELASLGPVLSSAATPAQVSHKIYGDLGWTHCDRNDHKYVVGIGGHYEAAHHNSVLSNWGMHARLAMSF